MEVKKLNRTRRAGWLMGILGPFVAKGRILGFFEGGSELYCTRIKLIEGDCQGF